MRFRHASEEADQQNRIERRLLGFVRQNITPLVLLAIVLVLIFAFAPQFFSSLNITNVARQSSITGIVAVGMTFVILTSGIDLSVGGILAVAGIVFSSMARLGYDIAFCLICSLLIGAIIGAINAFGVEFLGIQPFIMTLATSSITNGIALLICNGIPVEFNQVKDPLIDFLGNGNVGSVPGPFILFIAITVVSAVILRYVPFGRYVYSIGSSFEGARLAGIRTTRVILSTYVICGLCAALGGVITACRLYVGHPVAGGSMALDAIASIVIGGTRLSGGKGTVIGTTLGVLLMTVAANILNLLGISSYVQQIVKGIIIIAAILLSIKDIKSYFKRAWRGM
ncbi:ABC transporter permease [Christensenellaceae bacterium OttesenSCG-928-K19]|nr:ABC transporter permease [Christensenellaceae bacterium OttesenSCG-928-K19]